MPHTTIMVAPPGNVKDLSDLDVTTFLSNPLLHIVVNEEFDYGFMNYALLITFIVDSVY
jgi:hypothetical protein